MTSPIIPLVTAADRALVQEIANLWSDHLFGEISTTKLRKRLEVRLAKHRVEGFMSATREGEPPPPDTPAPRRRGKVVGKDPCDPYHWRRCE